MVVFAAVGLVVACGPQPASEALPGATPSADELVTAVPTETPSAVPADTTQPPASATAAPVPTAVPKPPRIEKKTVIETRSIPFTTRTVNDATLAKGTKKTKTKGVAGVKTLTYEVTTTDGKQTGKKLIREAVTKAPVTQVVAVGTKAASKCDPNYSGCVPIASDVDCAGGSGNGPAYVTGPVKVIGDDIYDLDRDGDGYGCD
ncbi:G5 domain-containing protein [Micromonospora sp. NBC_01699]|uniref:G5 domain-containing protein n=1 Tax=Micromonospora sp. NBC_01699 TaxID=2975984 RepID=UPI002E2E7FF7|nr:G5 domain-containing protein [Micromonospora sp. NBC_01699]